METCIIEHRIMQDCIMEHCFIHKLAFFILWSQKFLLGVQFLLIGYKFQYSSDVFAASLKCITSQSINQSINQKIYSSAMSRRNSYDKCKPMLIYIT